MTKFALLIGVSDYLETSFPALPATTQDVQGMKEVLQNPEIGDFKPDNIKTLINPHHPEMSEAIETYFSDSVSDDLILFYFSGHGVKDDQRNLYFSAHNTRKYRDKLTISTAVAASFVREMMKLSKAKRKIIILDCCFSGAFGDLIGKNDGSIDIERELGAEGTVVLASCSSTQYSFQQKNAELSLYTRYLVEGMKTGAADQNRDGFISVDELHNYASGRVQEAAPALVTPKIIVLKDEGYKISLAKAPKGDPILKYRQEVAQRAREGKFSIAARRMLDRLKIELNLSSAQAEAIEAEVLQPYREYQGNLQEYEETLKEAIKEEYPLSQDSLKDLKDYQQYLGLRDEDIKPIEAKAYYNRGLAKDDLGDYQGAITDFTQAIQLQPDYANAYINRGIAKRNLGDKQGALADYTQAIQLQPDHAVAYYNCGVVKYYLGDYQGALADYTQAIQLKPDYVVAYNNRGVAKDDLGDKQGALADYNQVIQLKPDYAEAYNNCGAAKSDLGDNQGAITDYTESIRLKNPELHLPYNKGALADYQQAAKLYQQQNKIDDYLDVLNQVKKIE